VKYLLIFVLFIFVPLLTGCATYREAYKREYAETYQRLAEMERFNTIHITIKYEDENVKELEVLPLR